MRKETHEARGNERGKPAATEVSLRTEERPWLSRGGQWEEKRCSFKCPKEAALSLMEATAGIAGGKKSFKRLQRERSVWWEEW